MPETTKNVSTATQAEKRASDLRDVAAIAQWMAAMPKVPQQRGDCTLSSLEDFTQRFENTVYGLAATRDVEALRQLFSTMPSLLQHVARRPLPWNKRDWGWLSVPWAIFQKLPGGDATSVACVRDHDATSAACVRMLKDVGFKPDHHFFDRMMRHGSFALILDVLEVFEIDTAFPPPGHEPSDEQGSMPVLAYALGSRLKEDLPDALDLLAVFLRRCSNVNVECFGRTELFSLLVFYHRQPELAVRAAEMLLAAGAKIDVTGRMNGRDLPFEGQDMTLREAVAWARSKNSGSPLLLSFAEAHSPEIQASLLTRE